MKESKNTQRTGGAMHDEAARQMRFRQRLERLKVSISKKFVAARTHLLPKLMRQLVSDYKEIKAYRYVIQQLRCDELEALLSQLDVDRKSVDELAIFQAYLLAPEAESLFRRESLDRIRDHYRWWSNRLVKLRRGSQILMQRAWFRLAIYEAQAGGEDSSAWVAQRQLDEVRGHLSRRLTEFQAAHMRPRQPHKSERVDVPRSPILSSADLEDCLADIESFGCSMRVGVGLCRLIEFEANKHKGLNAKRRWTSLKHRVIHCVLKSTRRAERLREYGWADHAMNRMKLRYPVRLAEFLEFYEQITKTELDQTQVTEVAKGLCFICVNLRVDWESWGLNDPAADFLLKHNSAEVNAVIRNEVIECDSKQISPRSSFYKAPLSFFGNKNQRRLLLLQFK